MVLKWMLPQSHSTCHVQHTVLLCFINCFNHYIWINTDIKTTAIGVPPPVKCYAARSQSQDLCLVFEGLSNVMHLTQDRVWAPLISICSTA